jgi:hypothetical protein
VEGGGFTATPRWLYAHERDTVSIVQEAGWDPGQVWTAAENIALSGIRFPDRLARSLRDPCNQSNLYGPS